MTYQFKGFINLNPLVRNAKDDNSAVGEISTQSLTYAKDVGVYAHAESPDVRIYSFLSQVVESGPVVMPELIIEAVGAIGQWVYNKQMAVGAPTTRAPFLADLTQQYNGLATQIDCGELVNGLPGKWFPEWIRLKLTDLPEIHLAHDNTLTFWFADASFRNQYDEGDVIIVPPLPNIDTFFQGRAAVAAALAAQTLSNTYQRVDAAAEDKPYTLLAAEEYNYVNPSNVNDKLRTSWNVIRYGIMGDDIDSTRQAVRDYISAHSAHPESEWRVIFPEIYKSTEFTVFPRWKNYANEEMAHTQGIYSPIVSYLKELGYLKLNIPGMDATHIDAHAQVIPTYYKSLALSIVGGEFNRDQLFSIVKVFKDLINVPTSDPIFSAQGPLTQEWVILMERALIEAEKVTAYSSLPSGMRKVTRSNVLFVTFKHNNIDYLVASKASTPAYI